ncbi:MAG: hypothetical protein IH609_20675 [Dehalococcoidia bacterium]|nr:hypothetical protein [Dehalococcoidia bacterium]
MAVALLAIFASIGAGLAVRSTASADGDTPLSNQGSLGNGVSGTRACEPPPPFYQAGKTDEWHFLINDIKLSDVPDHIHAVFNTGSVVISLEKTVPPNAGPDDEVVAHYTLWTNLSDTLLSATADLVPGTYNNFNLSHAPCGQGEPPVASISIDKTVNTSWTRTCTWEIEKTATPLTLTLAPNTTGSVDYNIHVDVDCVDGAYTVSGTITVNNDGNVDVDIDTVTDSLGPVTNCVPALTATLAPGASLTCDYSATVANGDGGTNIANASGTSSEGPVSDEIGKAYTFAANPTTTVDGCVLLEDDKNPGRSAVLCYNNEPDDGWDFNYSLDVPAGEVGCTEVLFTNTATVRNRTTVLDSDSATVTITVTCVNGKTQGFWSNKNGQALITVTPITTLGADECSLVVDTKATSLKILPGKNGHNGLSLMEDCDLADGISEGAFNNLLSQTLALYLNQTYIPGYDGQTINGLNCAAYIGSTGLTGASTIDDVLTEANAAIAAGGTNAGDFNALLGCLNREA